MTTSFPAPSTLSEDLMRQIKTPVFLTDGRAEKLLAWNEAFADYLRSAALVPGRPLAEYLPNAEALAWLAGQFSQAGGSDGPEPVWSGQLAAASHHFPASVKMRLFHVDQTADVMAVGLQLILDWLFSVNPGHLRAMLNN